MSFPWLSFGRYNASAETDYSLSLTTYIYDTCVMQATAELAKNLRRLPYLAPLIWQG